MAPEEAVCLADLGLSCRRSHASAMSASASTFLPSAPECVSLEAGSHRCEQHESKQLTDRMLRLALFLFPGNHLGAWRLPEAIPEFDVGIEHYVRAAQLAEEAKLDAIFFEDQAAIPRSNDILKGNSYGAAHPRAIHFDPMMLLPALAMTTKHLGLAATSTASFNEPYNVLAGSHRSISSATDAPGGIW